MPNFIVEAGWPIYPILALGSLSLIQSARYALTAQRDILPLIVGLLTATVAMGAFGTIVGFMYAVEGTRDLPPEQKWLCVVGLKEALNNLAVACAFVVVDALVAMVGGRKLLQRLDDIASKS
jgi:hypothetical protein